MKSAPIKIGDPVEIKFATHDGYIWHPGVVTFVGPTLLDIELKNGFRECVDRSSDKYRIVQKNFA